MSAAKKARTDAGGYTCVATTLEGQQNQSSVGTVQDGDLAELVPAAADYAIATGMLSRSNDGGVDHVPATLFPTPFPAKELAKALKLQPHFNTLMDKVQGDAEFLTTQLCTTTQGDAFTSRLLAVQAKAAKHPDYPTPLRMTLHRADYMLHSGGGGGGDTSTSTIAQVEINTISCAFGGLACKPLDLHRFVMGRYLPDAPALPDNAPHVGLAAGMAKCVEAYEGKYGCEAVVCMVVQPGEKNTFDQRLLEYALWHGHKVKVIRRSLGEINATSTTKDNNALVIDGMEIALCYYRAGYRPEDYPTEAEWDARVTVEKARCAKCPCINDHLSGAKKVQQVLANPGTIERFVADAGVAKALRSTFMGMYTLTNDAEGDAAAKLALASPDNYVMKPQREGGGNMLSGEDMCTALKTMSPGDRAAYILMERIVPPHIDNYIMRASQVSRHSVVSELGVFGMLVKDGDEVVANIAAGHLLRTKPRDVEDGGVAAGRAVLDSPFPVA